MCQATVAPHSSKPQGHKIVVGERRARIDLPAYDALEAAVEDVVERRIWESARSGMRDLLAFLPVAGTASEVRTVERAERCLADVFEVVVVRVEVPIPIMLDGRRPQISSANCLKSSSSSGTIVAISSLGTGSRSTGSRSSSQKLILSWLIVISPAIIVC